MFYLLHQVLHNTRYCTQTVNFSLPSLLRCLQRGEKKVQKKLVFAGRSYDEKRKFWKPSVHSQGLQFTSFSSKPFFWNHGFSENHGFKKKHCFLGCSGWALLAVLYSSATSLCLVPPPPFMSVSMYAGSSAINHPLDTDFWWLWKSNHMYWGRRQSVLCLCSVYI